MKKFLPFLFVLCSLQVSAQTTKVLFIGNSYVATNNLPQTFYNLALSLGDTVFYDSNSPGGQTFQNHTTNTTTLSKINANAWDYVILQAQSQEPSFPPAQVQANTYPYARFLDSLIHVNNPCTKTMFYMTWGRKYGDASNCGFYTPLCTFEGMNQRLRESYLEMSANNFAQTAPVGIAWKNARMIDSTINLWSADNSHPSVAGTYLTACVFYASIFKQTPVGSNYTAGLTVQQAGFLQQVASSTVLDSLDTWMLNQDPIHAGFIPGVNLLNVNFISDCYNAAQFSWDFGDGNVSNQQNPLHTYTTAGSYNVQLIASNGCYSDTVIQQVTVSGIAGMENNPYIKFSVYPNPATERLVIETPGIEELTLMDLNGKALLNFMVKGKPDKYELLLQELAPGTYILNVTTIQGKLHKRIIKN